MLWFGARCMNTWRLRFEDYLKADPVAFRMLDRLVKRGFSRHQVLLALENYTNPRASRELRRAFEQFAPTKNHTRKLAGQCSRLTSGLREIYGSPFGVSFPEAGGMLGMADVLERSAVWLNKANHTKQLSMFTEKSLWNGLPLAVLYEELNIPRSLTWDNWHPLYRVARQAHRLPDDLIGPKSMATNHRRFLKRNPRVAPLVKFLAQWHAQLCSATPKHPL
jgi:hypothetical protein